MREGKRKGQGKIVIIAKKRTSMAREVAVVGPVEWRRNYRAIFF